MGVMCPCGVIVRNPLDPNNEAVSNNNNVKFEGQMGTITGNLFYKARICVTTLESSTLSLRFQDTETPNVNNFTFTANAITSVECKQEGQNCSITVAGTGIVNGMQFPFVAIFRDQVGQAQVDDVQAFEITGFFNQTGAAPIDQGSIIALGCQEV